MEAIERLREAMPPFARDIQLNLSSVLQGGVLSDEQRWGIALACALAAGDPSLRDAVLEDATTKVGDGAIDDARAAAALMAMNNVFYRFRHMVGKESYATKPARLRMNRIAQPRTDKATFELMLPGGQRDQRLRGVHPEPRARRAGRRADRGPRHGRRPDRGDHAGSSRRVAEVTRGGSLERSRAPRHPTRMRPVPVCGYVY